ncbi:MAG: NHLP bacteriocin export ABC transporter permease/ATPase subunit [Bryobacteraceae bacterium]
MSGLPVKGPSGGIQLWDNQPLWLDDAGTAWKVESGGLGIFAATRSAAARGDVTRTAPREPAGERDDRPVTGARHFLFGVAPGEIIPPMPAPAGDWQLMALSLEESRIRPLPYPPRTQDVKLELAIAHWLEHLGRAAGTGQPAGGPDFQPWPEENSLQALDRLTPAFYEAWSEKAAHQEQADRRRFDERQRVDEALATRALEHLADATASGAREHIALEGSRLLVALRAIGRVQGITIRPAVDDGSRHSYLSAIAQRSGFRTRMVVLSGPWWEQENGPLLGFLKEGNQPVALLPAHPGVFGEPRYELFDPADGSRRRVDAETAFSLEPRGYVLYRSFPRDRRTMALIRFALENNWRDLRTIVLAGIFAMALGLVAPQATSVLIDQAIPDADRNMVWQLALAMLASAVGAMLFLLTQSLATLRVQSALYTELQSGVWDYLLKLRPAFFRRHTAGDLSARAYALTRMEQILSTEALRALFAGVASFVTLVLMFYYDLKLGSIALASGLVVIGWLAIRMGRLSRLQARVQEVDGILSGMVLQLINAVSKLRVAGAERRAFAHWTREYSRKQTLSLRVQELKDEIRLVNLTVPVLALAFSFLYMLGPGVPTARGADGAALPLGTFLAFIAAQTLFLTSLTQASDVLAGMVVAYNLWNRVRGILEETPEVDTSKSSVGRLHGRIDIEHATFRYRHDGPLTLDGVTIHATPGQCIALTGPSGSGKSTILNLLLHFETPMSGAIYLDGHELSSLDITAVRRQIGVVTQDGKIMSGSIFENIASGGFCTMEQAWEAARAAGLAEDIENMPMGMHTVISEGGGNISGGQRQRLLIARALVRNPSIVVFDEATSALDNRTQAIVTASLNRLKVTRILVAHRLSTIRQADRIYVIEAGRVVQQGSYDELMTQEGLFARLVQRQSA